MEEAQVRTLDIFPATDCKPNFSNCNISLWLIITSLATIKARLFFETFHFFASRDVHASFTAKTISLLLLLIRLLAQYLGFTIDTFGCWYECTCGRSTTVTIFHTLAHNIPQITKISYRWLLSTVGYFIVDLWIKFAASRHEKQIEMASQFRGNIEKEGKIPQRK